MPRYAARVESVAAIASNIIVASIFPAAATNCRLTRVWLGTSISGAITSQQVVVGLARITTNGTTPAGQTMQNLDPNSNASQIGAAAFVTSWATPPTTPTTFLTSWSFNTQAGQDIPVDLPEEYWCLNNNGLCFVNLDNALPSNHKIALGVETFE